MDASSHIALDLFDFQSCSSWIIFFLQSYFICITLHSLSHNHSHVCVNTHIQYYISNTHTSLQITTTHYVLSVFSLNCVSAIDNLVACCPRTGQTCIQRRDSTSFIMIRKGNSYEWEYAYAFNRRPCKQNPQTKHVCTLTQTHTHMQTGGQNKVVTPEEKIRMTKENGTESGEL